MTIYVPRILLLLFVLALSACVETGQIAQTLTSSTHPSTRSADGFDFPVAPPDGNGYSKSRGFRAGGHLGEDWITDGGSAKGFRNPVYTIGNGLVVLARDIHADWGNVVIVRHGWIEHRELHFTDSLYGHLDRIIVHEGQQISRGEQVGLIGNNHGMYPPHLHFEMHKDLAIGVNHTQGTRDLHSYWVPTDFIMSHRHLSGGGQSIPVPPALFLLPTPEHPWSFHHFLLSGRHTHHRSTQHTLHNRISPSSRHSSHMGNKKTSRHKHKKHSS